MIILTSIHLLSGTGSTAPPFELWTFDNIKTIGGHPVQAEGNPRVIDTPMGKAVEFNGKNDALFLDVHPLAGAETFTWEVIFRPDADGAKEQRFFHLQEGCCLKRGLWMAAGISTASPSRVTRIRR